MFTFILANDYREMSQAAAQFIAREILHKERSVLGLPTGETPKEMYSEIVRLYREGLIDFSKITTFNLDEYLGIDPDHPLSFHSYMREHFCDHVNLKRDRMHIPLSLPEDEEAECAWYEQLIDQEGGLDLVVVGIGPNGHIGFNEPGTSWGTLTHVSELSRETREREGARFQEGDRAPERAITMGIKTIMHARKVLLLASGSEKAGILSEALFNAPTPSIPASVLQLHPSLTIIADRAAGEKQVRSVL
jgi:glucosamine-6-phosphate deaminase